MIMKPTPTCTAGDNLMSVSKALGNSYSDPLMLTEAPLTLDGRHLQSDELFVSIPPLTATELPTGASYKVSIEFSDNANFTGDVLTITDSRAVITSSMAEDGMGCSFRIPYQCGQYCRMKIESGGTPGATTKEVRLDYLVP